MNIYIYIPIFVFAFYFFDTIIQNKKSKVLFFILFLFLLVIAGFRECGFDYYSYYTIFESLQYEKWATNALDINIELGYAFINHIIGDYRLLIFFMTFVLLVLQMIFIYKYSFLPFLSMFFYLGIFFYNTLMGQFRQGIAIGFILWAIVYKNDLKKFIFCIFSALLFHYTALIGLIIPFIPNQISKIKNYIGFLLAAFLLNFIFSKINFGFLHLSSFYLDTKIDAYQESENLGLNLAILIRIALFFVCYAYRALFSNNEKMKLFLNFYFLSLVIYIAFSSIPALASRGSVYFSFFEIILSANIIFLLWKSKNVNRVVSMVLFVTFISFSIYRQMRVFDGQDASDAFIPYVNWFLSFYN